ncbi:unnamed protein product [Prorocentrum cordatum]|uniref:DNA 3'-5' helicase n=1 Tax=Prorocentrum cordatum TaxID=2364126 RepID=A0ABN9PEN8_9DINO|nr:unnamed protein product [Polarella glacialis]
MHAPREDLEKLTVAQLKELLREAGLKVSGTKAELMARLDAQEPPGPALADPEEDHLLQSLRESFPCAVQFNPGQRTVIEAVLRRESAAAIFPTGGGKSLCFQLPALQLDGLTLVVSPLIALMKDQVDQLRALGVGAQMVASSLDFHERAAAWQEVQDGTARVLYLAPEQLINEGTLAKLSQCNIALLAVDEAHCISEWGHTFRPSYLRLSEFAAASNLQVLCLTATATEEVAKDICAEFRIPAANCVRTAFHRGNLSLKCAFPESEQDRDALLVERLRTQDPGPTIVYTTLRRTASEVAGTLKDNGLDAEAYHAGMNTEERTRIQDWFMGSDSRIVVATIAFGMGVDKANIRYVYHYNFPSSLESYVQEVGRSGRDGLPSTCEVLFRAEDREKLEEFARGSTPDSPEQVQKLFQDFFAAGPGNDPLRPGARLEVSVSKLASDHGLKSDIVHRLLAYVEHYHKHICRGTPRFAAYDVKAVGGALPDTVSGLFDQSPAGAALRDHCVSRRIWACVDVEAAAQESGLKRDELEGVLFALQTQGLAEVKRTGLVDTYKVHSVPADLGALAAEEFARTKVIEERALARIQDVVAFLEAGCPSQVLLERFGSADERRELHLGLEL